MGLSAEDVDEKGDRWASREIVLDNGLRCTLLVRQAAPVLGTDLTCGGADATCGGASARGRLA